MFCMTVGWSFHVHNMLGRIVFLSLNNSLYEWQLLKIYIFFFLFEWLLKYTTDVKH